MFLEIKIVNIIAKRYGKVLRDLEWRILYILLLNRALVPILGTGEICVQLMKGILNFTCDLCTFLYVNYIYQDRKF